MTTTVTIEAHCNKDTEVLVRVVENGTIVETTHLTDGEKHVVYAYNYREIRVLEVPAL
jgi:hypothetical protein